VSTGRSPQIIDGDTCRWVVSDPDPTAIERIAQALGIDKVVAALLVNRGVSDPVGAKQFLEPSWGGLHDPWLLPDVDKAVERLARALADGERIFVHGDYDADGVTSAALCQRALLALGADVVGHVPHRGDGYDLQVAGVERALEEGASLILTSDCGVCAIEAVEHANDLGIDVIVTDHHRPGTELPPAVAVVNPYRSDSKAPFRDLCGAGVAFKVFDALYATVRPDLRDAFRRNLVDLAALGTIADVTSLVGENRILVSQGLAGLAAPRKKGLMALLIALGLNESLRAEDVAFRIGPTLNAAGRMDDASIAYRLLTTRDTEEAESLVAELTELNRRRREESERILTEASIDMLLPENADRRVLVLARSRWGKGLVGPAASRIAELARRPAILLAFDPETESYTGSGRSWGDFNLLHALHECKDLLGRYGGHHASAGVSVSAENLDAFREQIHAVAEGLVPETPEPPQLRIDAEIADGNVVNRQLTESIGMLEPYGRGNEAPVFLTRGAILVEAKAVGRDLNTAQFQFRLPGSSTVMKGIRFKSGEWVAKYPNGSKLDIAYRPKANEFRGNVSVDLHIEDWRLSPSG